MRDPNPPAVPNPAEAILATLNKAQCRAVTSSSDTVAILAGPGSGKTHTLTSRVVWLVDAVGYAPADIVVATFTVKAAREMKERMGKALGGGRERKIVLGTFHSIARRYLATYGQRIGLDQKFGIADDGDSRAIIQRICKRLQLALDPPAARAWISKKKAKGTTEPPKQNRHKGGKPIPENPELETCYREYQDQLKRSGLLDYDDLLTKCVELLEKHPSCVGNVQAVLIDEYQDTNGIQYELMKLFAQARRRITIVGDPDQSIYGWRSAEVKNLYRLLKDFPQTDEISLEENYRSSQSILDVSLKVIRQDKKRYQKALLPVHNKGTRPVLRRLRTAAVEAEWIVSEIRRAIVSFGGMMTHDDIAILLRSAALSRHIESALGKAGVSYKMVGGFKFYERAEVKVIIDYLRVIHQPESNDAVSRIINVPRRGVGDATVKALLEEAEVAKMSIWALLVKHCRGDRKAKTNIKKAMEQKISGELIRMITSARNKLDRASNDKSDSTDTNSYNLVEVVQDLLSQLNFQKYLQETYPQEHENRWANVQEFISLAGDFMRDLQATAEDDKLPEIHGLEQVQETDPLGRFLANVSLASDAQKGEEKGKAVVTISTIHAAKGLEWPIVFVPAVFNGSIPHSRSEDWDEERRLLYVAMTRAKSLLYLSSPLYGSQAAGNSGGEKTEVSPFIPTDIHSSFVRKGPSFNAEVIRQVGRILGREQAIPSADKIFGKMPLGESLEDSLYPEDPEHSDDRSAGAAGKAHGKNGWQSNRRRGPADPRDVRSGTAETASLEEAYPWYSSTTTMQASSSFTIASLPGFQTAGAHRSALLAAAKEPSLGLRDDGQRRHNPTVSRRGGTTKRPADQHSLLGFMAKKHRSDMSHMAREVEPAPRDSRVVLNRALSATHVSASVQIKGECQGEKTSAIAPDLAGHRLGSGVIPKQPKPRKDKEEPSGGVPVKNYPNFSSSPSDKSPEANRKGAEDAGRESEVEVIRDRPASCMHVTTTMVPPGYGGFSRPMAPKREGGIAPIDRLRKPFKPLTIINRGGK